MERICIGGSVTDDGDSEDDMTMKTMKMITMLMLMKIKMTCSIEAEESIE